VPHIKTADGAVLEEIQQATYDSYDLLQAVNPSTIGTIPFFTAVQGEPLAVTNLKQNGMFSARTSFRVTGLALLAQNQFAANKAALPLIMEHSSLDFVVDRKSYWQGNASLAAGRIYQQAASSTADDDAIIQSYGSPAARSVVFSRLHTVDIEELTNFEVNWSVDDTPAAQQALTTPAAGTQIRFIMVLYGLLRRSVQ
jgi:hypothetical protein